MNTNKTTSSKSQEVAAKVAALKAEAGAVKEKEVKAKAKTSTKAPKEPKESKPKAAEFKALKREELKPGMVIRLITDHEGGRKKKIAIVKVDPKNKIACGVNLCNGIIWDVSFDDEGKHPYFNGETVDKPETLYRKDSVEKHLKRFPNDVARYGDLIKALGINVESKKPESKAEKTA